MEALAICGPRSGCVFAKGYKKLNYNPSYYFTPKDWRSDRLVILALSMVPVYALVRSPTSTTDSLATSKLLLYSHGHHQRIPGHLFTVRKANARHALGGINADGAAVRMAGKVVLV